MKKNLNLYLLQAYNASARFTHDKIFLTISFFSLLFVLISTVASAQTKTITGIVRDDEQQVLVGVSVAVKGTNQGVLTGEDGRFSITVDVTKNDALVLSYIGKKNSEVSIAEKNNLDVTMYTQPDQLIEIVVTGAAADDEVYTEAKSEKKRSRKEKRLF
jgi:hypothetical protein